ncbi:response regulator transcription factor [Chloroflexota bacterium]
MAGSHGLCRVIGLYVQAFGGLQAALDKLTRYESAQDQVGRGISNRDIALELGISLRTVKGHLMNIFAKMKVKSRTEAVLYALKHRWIVLDEII